MTSQPLPAGWYPDPTDKIGQKYWDGHNWEGDKGLAPATGHAAQHSPDLAHLYKNPVLYALGGLLLPPLVLFLMGGDRASCAWIVGLWVLFLMTVWFFGIGAIFVFAGYLWSVAACYQEAIKQNKARGLV